MKKNILFVLVGMVIVVLGIYFYNLVNHDSLSGDKLENDEAIAGESQEQEPEDEIVTEEVEGTKEEPVEEKTEIFTVESDSFYIDGVESG